ncbi:F12F1.11-RELATED [Salix koriyanagi]|uniref:F12F1.11-RELATED n=1 Tax=Salix koriyanagi TaxID=2511006 RepID=A0A9Q0UY87_9ROSI|nr:F12F1.11-RELATED [Salix koriyanagi]
MKKLYCKGTVHPSTPIISDHLSFLPVTILTLAAALSPEDREVLAYLISCSGKQQCLLQQLLIHEIIDAFEDWLLKQGDISATNGNKNRKDRKRKGNRQGSSELIKRPELRMKDKLDESVSIDGNSSGGGGSEVVGGGEEGTEKGSVRGL